MVEKANQTLKNKRKGTDRPIEKIALALFIVFLIISALLFIRSTVIEIKEGVVGLVQYHNGNREILYTGRHYVGSEKTNIRLYSTEKRTLETSVSVDNGDSKKADILIKAYYALDLEYVKSFYGRFRGMEEIEDCLRVKLETFVKSFYFDEVENVDIESKKDEILNKFSNALNEDLKQIIILERFDDDEKFSMSASAIIDKDDPDIPKVLQKITTEVDDDTMDVFVIDEHEDGYISKVGFYGDIFTILDINVNEVSGK